MYESSWRLEETPSPSERINKRKMLESGVPAEDRKPSDATGQPVAAPEPLPMTSPARQDESAPRASGQEAVAQQPALPAEQKPVSVTPRKSPAVFGWIIGAALAIVALMGAVGFICSLMDVTRPYQWSDSAFIGMENYQRILSGGSLLSMLRNSAVLRLIQLAAGTALALPMIAWVKMGKKPGRTLTKAFLCLAPFCLPYINSAYAAVVALPREIAMDSMGGFLMYALATGLQTAGFIAFCGGFFAYLKMRGIGKGASQGVLTALLILCLTLLTCDDGSVQVIANGMNRAWTNTLDRYANQLMNSMKISLSAAVSAVKVALQAVLGIGAAALLCKIAKKDETRTELPDAQGSLFTFTSAKLVWLVLLAVLAGLTFGIQVIARQPEETAQVFADAAREATQDSLVTSGALISLIVAGLGGALGGLVAYSLIVYFRSGRKGFGLAMLLAASSLSFWSIEYMVFSEVGLFNTVWPMILRQVFDSRLVCLMIALAVVLRMAPERRTGWILAGLICFGAAFAWGDFTAANFYVFDASHSNLAHYLYRLFAYGSIIRADGAVPAQALSRQAMTTIISLLTSLPAVLLGFGGAACCIRSFKQAE